MTCFWSQTFQKLQVSAPKSLFFESKIVFSVVFQHSKQKNVPFLRESHWYFVFTCCLAVFWYSIFGIFAIFETSARPGRIFCLVISFSVAVTAACCSGLQMLEYRNQTCFEAVWSGEPLRLSAGGFPRFNFVLQFWMDQKVWQRNPSCWFRSWRKTFSALRYQDPIILHRFSQIEEFFGDRNNSVW